MLEGLYGFVMHTWLPFIKLADCMASSLIWSLLVLYHDGWSRPRADKKRVPWWAQHTSWMYCFFVFILVPQLMDWNGVMQNYYSRGHGVHLEEPNHTVFPDTHGNWTECVSSFHEQISLEAVPHITQFALTTPFWVIGTLLVSGYNTMLHVKKSSHRVEFEGGGAHETLWRQPSRNLTIWILQLPVVYSITALYSVSVALERSRKGAQECMTDPGMLTFEYETALSFGDAYEGVALLLFAKITLYVIKARVDKIVDKAASLRENITGKERRPSGFSKNGQAHPEKPGLSKQTKNDIVEVDKMLEHVTEKLAESTSDLASLGIVYFSTTCFIQALPAVFACQMRQFAQYDIYRAARTTSESWLPTVKGMGLLGSCVAIHNMVSIEKSFEADFLEDFEPTAKFISVKIMVSIVFIQEMFLPIVLGLTVPRAQVLDATLRCFEFFLISIFNLWAWNCEHGWYLDDISHLTLEKDLSEEELAKLRSMESSNQQPLLA